MPIATRKSAPTPVQDSIPIPPKVPQLPDDVLKRFPSLADWQEDENSWWDRTTNALQSNNRTVSQSVTKQAKDTSNLVVSFNDFKVVIQDEVDTIVTDQVAMGRRIISVSAQVGVNQNIKIQNSAPVGPALNDYWIDNSDLVTPITYKWNGAQWVEVTDPIAVAGVADERTARVTADGFLEGKYTLTVIAGNVVTGMNITSSTGGGVDVSSVIFRATDFQIYNGVIGKTMFSVSGTDVQLAGVLTVSTSGKVYIGTGTYGNVNTAWYVDSTGKFSLKDKLTWDGTTLSVGNAYIDSNGAIVLGTANDVLFLSAADATYRIWVGNATAGSAAFSVTKAGALFSTSGTIGGFTIAANSLSAGAAGTSVLLSNDAGTGIRLGDSTAQHVLLRRSVGGSVSLFLFNASNLATGIIQVDVATGCGSIILSNNAGTTVISLDASTGAVIAPIFSGGNGAVGAPTYSWGSDPDTGWYWSSSGTMNAATNGTARLTIRDAAIVLLVPLKFDTAAQNIGVETLQKYITAQDSAGTTVKLAIVV